MAGAQPRDVAITGGALLYLLTQSWPLLRPVAEKGSPVKGSWQPKAD